ncbi:S-Ena type endospore appendage [Bacillus alveayuensis]|uniref:S-Ena type endospore appendage n=1 Tax=Aeribacillus alveayuensis TaxID=279215 RepID=UPI0005D131F8|nr:S-Ena type endospore appendage [Bacillus alveayuensis]
MSKGNCQTVCCPLCIGSGGTLDGGDGGKELIKLNLCQPLRQECDDTPDTIFSSGPLPSINGVFTVNNKSSDCTMTVTVIDANNPAPGTDFIVPPGSSVAVAVEAVELITYTCAGDGAFCTGAFEANFYYCAEC